MIKPGDKGNFLRADKYSGAITFLVGPIHVVLEFSVYNPRGTIQKINVLR